MSARALELDKAAEVVVAQAKPGVAPGSAATQTLWDDRRAQGSLSLAIGKLLTRRMPHEVGGGWLQSGAVVPCGTREASDATYQYRATLPLLASSARHQGTR
jgi:hypothetical protein